MSRNLRQKAAAATDSKDGKRRGSSSSASHLSSDDGYSGVEDVSDSEDDDEDDVIAAEAEQMLKEDESPWPETDGDDDDVEDGDDEGGEDGEEDDNASTESDAGDAWVRNGIMSDGDGHAPDSARPERHVRFTGVPDSDSDSTDTDDDHADFFPDIFVEQNLLDPEFRREIEHDPDDSSNSGTYWDYYGTYDYNTLDSDVDQGVTPQSEEETPIATPIATRHASLDMSTPVQAANETDELDGYETDGDTTEEDIPGPLIKRRPRRDPSTELLDSGNDKLIKLSHGKPRVGRFNLDKSDTKPIAVLNPLTRKMMIFTPHRHRHLDLSPEQFDWQAMDNVETTSPILSNSASLMISAMFASNTFGDFLNSQPIGPAEAFFQLPTQHHADESSDSSGEEEDEEERNLNIEDFITFDDDASDSQEGEFEEWNGISSEPTTPARPGTASSDTETSPHLNPEIATAFRRNQLNQQLILSSQSTEDSLAFSGPLNYTALKGIKSDRIETAAAPITPLRRRKPSCDLSMTSLEATSQKRKASEVETFGHKRHRSLSDANMVSI